jgi:RNA polymerase sigma-70 factor, ECF subfamily
MEDYLRLKCDDELVGLMLAGDEGAFTALYRRHQGTVFRFALQMSGSVGIAEDTVQDVFLMLMREGCNYDPSRGRLVAFLYGVARNYVLRRLTKDKWLVPMIDGVADDDGGELCSGPGSAVTDDPLSKLTRSEAIESVRLAVLGLPTKYREVVVLCDLHELSYADAAAALGCAVGTVRSRLHRARKLLSEKLRSFVSAGADDGEATTARCLI